jgi:hypothetical protein
MNIKYIYKPKTHNNILNTKNKEQRLVKLPEGLSEMIGITL